MNHDSWRTGALLLTSALSLAAVHPLSAQTAPATATPNHPEETVALSPFVVEASEDTGYFARDTLAGTRIRTSTRDVGSSISIVTAKFLEDTNSKNMEELLVYTPPALKLPARAVTSLGKVTIQCSPIRT